MDCKICGKDIREHDLDNIQECFESIGVKVDVSDIPSLINIAGISITTNPRHKFVSYNGFGVTYEDLNLEIMRFCLAGPKIKKMVPKWKNKSNTPIIKEEDSE